MKQFIYESWNGVMNARHNPLRHIQDLQVRHIVLQVLAWMAVIFVSLAGGLGLMGSSRPIFALIGVGLILVLSLPFLLFAFVTTLLNHINLIPKSINQVDQS